MDALSIYWNAIWREAQRVHFAEPAKYSDEEIAAFERRRTSDGTFYTAVTGQLRGNGRTDAPAAS